jgi:hypothetical protein
MYKALLSAAVAQVFHYEAQNHSAVHQKYYNCTYFALFSRSKPPTVTMLYLSWIACVTALLPLATAVCCNDHGNGRCDDGTSPTPCCAHGGCNIFCCNCDGGCRSRSVKRDLPLAQVERSDSINTSFMEADTEGAGNITVDRYLEYMGVTGDNEVWVKWFEE